RLARLRTSLISANLDELIECPLCLESVATAGNTAEIPIKTAIARQPNAPNKRLRLSMQQFLLSLQFTLVLTYLIRHCIHSSAHRQCHYNRAGYDGHRN